MWLGVAREVIVGRREEEGGGWGLEEGGGCGGFKRPLCRTCEVLASRVTTSNFQTAETRGRRNPTTTHRLPEEPRLTHTHSRQQKLSTERLGIKTGGRIEQALHLERDLGYQWLMDLGEIE